MSKPVVLLDLDNCIADDAWRIPFIDWSKSDPDARYHPYHAGAYYDEHDTKWLHELLADFNRSSIRLFVLTARPERYRTLTTMWLQERLSFSVEGLFMRSNGDHRDSCSLKEHQLFLLANPNNQYNVIVKDIVLAADDRGDVLDMYRGHGVKNVVPHAIHALCAYTPPVSAALSVSDILRGAAATFEQRNALYGDNYKHYGKLMQALFPRGARLETEAEWNRLALVFACANKLSRYTWANGGDRDSAHDMAVYAAMLQEMTP